MNKIKRQSLNKAYRNFLDIVLYDHPLESLKDFVTKDVMGYGTALDEKVMSLESLLDMVIRQRNQAGGIDIQIEEKPVFKKILEKEETAILIDELTLTMEVGEEVVQLPLRLSSILSYIDGQWKVVHWHGSIPKNTDGSDDAWHVEEWRRQKEELERLVAEKTAELQEKNRELVIEAALERVRARTMAMQSGEELSGVASVVYNEFLQLGITNFLSTGFHIVKEEEHHLEVWNYDEEQSLIERINVPLLGDPILEARFDAWKRQDAIYYQSYGGQQLQDHMEFLWPAAISSSEVNAAKKNIPDPVHFYFGNFTWGYLHIMTDRELPKDQQLILARFAKVFEQTYRRFLDLQKSEAQAREAQIEATLEKVRSASMAMHHTSELQKVINTVYQQFHELDIDISGGVFISINDEIEDEICVWGAGTTASYAQRVCIPVFDRPIYTRIVQEMKKGPGFFVEAFSHAEKIEFFQHMFKYPPYNATTPEHQNRILSREGGYTRSCAVGKHTSIFMINHHGRKFSKSDNDILTRFSRVFEQSYTRFLDLQKAEAQAREAQIEAALERVRARAMAMHHSEEMADASALLYKELRGLGIDPFICGYEFVDEEAGITTGWATAPDGSIIKDFVHHPITGDPVLDRRYESWKLKDPFFKDDLQGEANVAHHQFMATYFTPTFREEILANLPERLVFYTFNFSHGWLIVLAMTPLLDGDEQILIRFTKVFQQTYTRFLDLQKAEAQAREAQIEAALERVRARAMAMHKSEELLEVLDVVFTQLQALDFGSYRVSIAIVDLEKEVFEMWNKGDEVTMMVELPFVDYPVVNAGINAFKEAREFSVYKLTGVDKKNWDAYFFNRPELQHLPAETKAQMMAVEEECFSWAYMKHGCLQVESFAELPEDKVAILKRFAKVIDLSYTRMLDLQNAEAQAREAQIEVALERVRSASMAMHKSAELHQVVLTISEEINRLGLDIHATHLYRFDKKDTKDLHFWQAADGAIYPHEIHWPYLDHDFFNQIHRTRKSSGSFFTAKYSKNTKNRLLNHALDHSIAEVPEEVREYILNTEYVTGSGALSNNSGIFILRYSPEEFSDEENEVLKRFAKVFEQAYVRFLDLQKAEAQAREAIKQASLDRVRGQIASMRSTQDLDRITPLIWNELHTLGVPFIRCGVFIIDEATANVQAYLSDPKGMALAAMKLPFDANSLTSESVEFWRQGKVYQNHWTRQGFIDWTQSLIEQGYIADQRSYQGATEAPESLYLNFIPFTQGMLYVGNVEPLSAEAIDLVQSLAESFAIAYARYEDFVKLELAKQNVESTLSELQATQKQLIQSEKMASLGELTAGIAHEIQNPLNFVNNFSEVSKELLDELNEELEEGKVEDAREIAGFLIQNLDKIEHHGKRADAIVKSMLQHSRSSTGIKEPTDINALADEYLRLAYHGMRAKDKSFNVTMETTFDEQLGKIDVIPQEIGRVLLNLITNAFHAVSERKNQERGDFKPTVILSTSNIGDRIAIKVKDNGKGIPEKIVDKIFQPFFTTKPTGQGTGLGLSLAYDIVKAHGGEMKVKSTEGEGATFTIVLPKS